MKRIILAALVSCVILLASCQENPADNGGDKVPVETDAPAENDVPDEPQEVQIDIDFTRLSSTIQSAQMQIILENIEDYVGQTIKIQGLYDYFFWEFNGKYFHDLIIDCPSGCPKRIEIISASPGDYPEVGAIIEVIGVFGYYREDGIDFSFPYLTVDEITVVQ
jgi:hypothetical protein